MNLNVFIIYQLDEENSLDIIRKNIYYSNLF